jgi:hypothetical protein
VLVGKDKVIKQLTKKNRIKTTSCSGCGSASDGRINHVYANGYVSGQRTKVGQRKIQ